jgi:hypothetical protein
MSKNEKGGAGKDVKFIAFLMIVGGVVGIGLSIWMALQTSGQQPAFAFYALVFSAVFGWATWKGVSLWRGKPDGYKWAKILFAAQIPTLSVPYFSYEFYTGLSIRLMFGDVTSNIGFNIGSSIEFYVSPAIQNTVFGVNIVAIVILAYLLKISRSN